MRCCHNSLAFFNFNEKYQWQYHRAEHPDEHESFNKSMRCRLIRRATNVFTTAILTAPPKNYHAYRAINHRLRPAPATPDPCIR